MDLMSNVNLTLSINNKDQLRDLYNYLNQKLITTINNLDGSLLGDNLITSQQALISADAVENDQESMALKVSCSDKVDSAMLLV